MVDPVVSFALQKLDEFISNELQSASRIRSDASWLQSELGFLQSFLADTRGNEENNARVRHLILEINDIARDIIDVLEKFRRESPRSKWIGRVRSCVGCHNGIFEIEEDMKLLKRKVNDISRWRQSYDINPRFTDQSNNLWIKSELRRTASYLDNGPPMVGHEDARQKLLDKLLKGKLDLGIVTIYGMGGLGKTTLAKSLYNSPEIVVQFPKRALTCVSQEKGIKETLRSVIKSFAKGYVECSVVEQLNDVEDMERYLHEQLKEQRYLVVIDDVWDRNILRILKRSFPDFCNGSRLIITTRNVDVTRFLDGSFYSYGLGFLNAEESWDLFTQKISYGSGVIDHYSDEIKGLGRDMVSKCGGLPLAIVVLRGLLVHKKPEEWYTVRDNIWSYVTDNSIEIHHLLSLSYDDPSSELKDCFLCLGMFPESQVIDAEKIMNLWMAEEFIEPSRWQRIEDVAEKYLKELIDRSLIQVEKSFWGKLSKLKLHDLLRILVERKAMEVNFFDNNYLRPKQSSFHPCKRYISWDEVDDSNFLHNYSERELRSLHLSHKCAPTHVTIERFVRFDNLSVLNLETMELLPDYDLIFRLRKLKFLGLTDIQKSTVILPSSLGKLKHLQTLEVLSHNFTATYIFPRETSKLTNLRHIISRVDGESHHISVLSNLTIMRNITYKSWNTVSPRNLQNLRELVIERIGDENSRGMEQIGLLRNLVTLVLTSLGPNNSRGVGLSFDSLSTCVNLRRLWLDGIYPTFKKFPPSVTMLKISNMKMEEALLRELQRLPNLRNLDLHELYFSSHILVFSSDCFPFLESLFLSYVQGLREMKIDNKGLANIKTVHIVGCKDLISIPDKFESILLPDAEAEMDSGFVFHCYPRIL